MKHVITAYAVLLILLFSIFTCVSMTNAANAMIEAKEFKAQVVAEIENSNFNPYVIEGCIRQANIAGYELQITNCVYDEYYNIHTAEVVLTYEYCLPMFGMKQIRTTRGVAR